MDLVTVKELYKNREQYFDKEVTVGGWVRSNRDSKTFGFIVVNDGSYFETLQIVYSDTMDNFAEITKLNVGAAIIVKVNDIHAQIHISLDDLKVEIGHGLDQLRQLFFFVHHVHQQVFVTTQVAQLEEGVSVAQTTANKVATLLTLTDIFRDLIPVEGTNAAANIGVRSLPTVKSSPVFQGMAGDHAGDAVIGGFPHTAEIIGIGMVLQLNQRICRGIGNFRTLKAGEQNLMCFHQIKKLGLIVVMEAGTVDRIIHRDVVWPLKINHS